MVIIIVKFDFWEPQTIKTWMTLPSVSPCRPRMTHTIWRWPNIWVRSSGQRTKSWSGRFRPRCPGFILL